MKKKGNVGEEIVLVQKRLKKLKTTNEIPGSYLDLDLDKTSIKRKTGG